MRSVFHGMRRRLSLPLFIGSLVIAAFLASTSLASANAGVIGLPETPPPPPAGFDFTAPDDDEPDPPAPSGPFDFTDGEGDEPDPTPPTGADDFVDGDGGESTPTPDGPDDVTDGDGGEGTPTPPGPDDFTDGDGDEPTDFPGPDDVTDGDPAPQNPDGTGEVPADDQESFEPAEPQTFDADAPVANVAALPVTGSGDTLGQDHAGLAPVFVVLSTACLLGTGLLTSTSRSGNHTRRR